MPLCLCGNNYYLSYRRQIRHHVGADGAKWPLAERRGNRRPVSKAMRGASFCPHNLAHSPPTNLSHTLMRRMRANWGHCFSLAKHDQIATILLLLISTGDIMFPAGKPGVAPTPGSPLPGEPDYSALPGRRKGWLASRESKHERSERKEQVGRQSPLRRRRIHE